jgi:hypothetical protein
MGYLPPVYIIKKIFNFVSSKMRRPVEHAAKAVVHVAASPALSQQSVGPLGGGGLYSDVAGAFAGCGPEPAKCGRVLGPVKHAWQLHNLFWGVPQVKEGVEAARGPLVGAGLWNRSMALVPAAAQAALAELATAEEIAEAAEGAGSARVRKVLAEVEAADAVKEADEVDEFDST